MDQYNINDIFVMFTVTSFLGFVFENIFSVMWNGYFDNRNMTLPFIHGYGDAVIGIFILSGIPMKNNIVLYFLSSFVLVCLSEIIIGTTVEKICGFVWWSYDNFPLHITHYTSVPTSLGFAALITVFMGFCFTPLMDMIEILPLQLKNIIGLPMFVLLTIDMVISYVTMYKKGAHNNRWRILITEAKNIDAETEKFNHEYTIPYYGLFHRR